MNLCRLCLFVLLTAAGSNAGFSTPAATPPVKSLPDLLFVQPVQRGTYQGDRLTIVNGDAPVLFFMNRPGRAAGHLTASRFLALWDEGPDSFRTDPPNAVLAIVSGETINHVVVELFGATASPQGVSYGVRVLDGTIPAEFGVASLFIDSFPTSVNSQITDSVTQANTKVLGDAPAMAMGNLYQSTAQALSNAAHNATNAQQQTNVTTQAATTMGVATLYSLEAASTGKATDAILKGP